MDAFKRSKRRHDVTVSQVVSAENPQEGSFKLLDDTK
jgi:hypothetical protein